MLLKRLQILRRSRNRVYQEICMGQYEPWPLCVGIQFYSFPVGIRLLAEDVMIVLNCSLLSLVTNGPSYHSRSTATVPALFFSNSLGTALLDIQSKEMLPPLVTQCKILCNVWLSHSCCAIFSVIFYARVVCIDGFGHLNLATEISKCITTLSTLWQTYLRRFAVLLASQHSKLLSLAYHSSS